MTSLFPEVTINGVTIASAAIAAEAQNHTAPAGKPGLAWRRAARALIIREAMLQEARRVGMTAEPQELAPGRRETEDEALIRALMEERIVPAPVSEDAMRATYDAAPDRFRAPDLWQVSHILYAARPDDTAARALAREGAARALSRLAANPDAFGRIAAEQSDCPSRGAGGQLGQIGPGETVPEFEAALADMAEGTICPDPVETRFGLHVIRMDACAKGAIRPFDAVRDEIAAALEKAAWAQAAQAFTAALLAGATVTGLDPMQPIH
ncbi:peptidylprolyl isomerase [Rhodovulum adriaticum]|uniref:Parvulin-like PPIase n=1 Tax=Rhodovulum adriaticum TaxID=35804 RepID=A0A4R2NZI5_RHOAD|nr:peptidylprolyl isomerase [Rhodovulum adriaticum]MBK1634827.1 peptidase [Rhodovulum adriaticum]TCP27597.1 peptidyl-prolyl cis-trans isomerase C [Rhodovulum adriaticum]